MASIAGDTAGQEFVRRCEALRTQGGDEEWTAESVSAAEEVATVILRVGNELDAHLVAGLPAVAGSVKELFAGENSAVFGQWLLSCENCCQLAFGARCGAEIAANLGQRFPNLCAQWLTSLKNLASAAFLASSALRKQGKHPTGSKTLALESIWPELGGIGGLRASRWRARVAAVELAVLLAVNDTTLASKKTYTSPSCGQGVLFDKIVVLQELLKWLVFEAATAPPEVLQVRLSAINGARAIIASTFHHLSGELYGELLGGLLATCMEPNPEVRKAGCESVTNLLLLSSPDGRQEVVLKLVDKFIKKSLLKAIPTLGDKPTGGRNLDGLLGDAWLADAVNSVINLLLLPGPPFFEWTTKYDNNVDRLPLLLVAVAAAFEEAEKLKNRVSAAKLERLIMSMRKPLYQASILAMLNPTLGAYPGALVARVYLDASILDGDEAAYVQNISRATVLRAIRSALYDVDDVRVDDFPSLNSLLPAISTRAEVAEGMKLAALQYIVEAFQVPSDLTRSFSTEESQIIAKEFLDAAKPLVHIAHLLLAGASGSQSLGDDNENLVQDLLLALAALASDAGEPQVEVVWTSKDLQKVAVNALGSLSRAFSWRAPDLPSKYDTSDFGTEVVGVEGMVLSLLPVMLPKIKQIIKSSSSSGTEDSMYTTPEGGDLSASIVASHQFAWCIKQVRQPHLGVHCQVVMPCALTALDHYSPVVKKQAMRVFIHLAENLKPSELRWYGDVTLDAVCRSLIGCGELWAVAIKMAVRLVISIEGQNPRGSWYRRTFVEMLDELQRHPEDQVRQVAWLETIPPQLEAMGLVLVGHFRQLLPLVFGWLHARDDKLCVLGLGVLKIVVTRTWCRMPFHANQIWEEVSAVYRDAYTRKLCSQIQAEVQEICRLLSLCCGPALAPWEKSRDDPALAALLKTLE